MTEPMNCVVIGGSGTIAAAMVEQLTIKHPAATIHVFSSKTLAEPKLAASTGDDNSVIDTSAQIIHHAIDYNDEDSMAKCALLAAQDTPLDRVFVGVGMLHNSDLQPEKSLSQMSAHNFETIFAANTITPALLAKHFIPKLNKKRPSIFAALSARVGSISDNRMGGWHAYRASKAALNMVLKNAALENVRRNKNAIIIGMHPGTVDSPLSKPFQRNVAEGKLFTPEYSASQLLTVMEKLSPSDSGKCFAWDGEEVHP